MPPVIRALRGATTVDVDEKEHLFERVMVLLGELFDRPATVRHRLNLSG
jgi:chorismate mutase